MNKGAVSMRKKLKRTFTSFVAVVILVTTLLSGAMFTVTAEGAKYMYNIYLLPDLSGIKGNTKGKIRTYSICFTANDADPAPGTYWSLANFKFTNLNSKDNSGKQTYGGYAGFQIFDRAHNKQSAAILSIFQHDYTKTDGTRASCMMEQNSKAVGPAHSEPACVHSVNPFTWKGDRWYRMVLHCWDYYDGTNEKNPSNGNTCIGMWIQDIASGQWTLFSYYDTKLKNSVMTGDMAFFMENFAPLEANNTRKYKVNRIYAKDASDDSWKSIISAEQKYTCGENGAIGTPSFSRDNYYSYFWGNITPQNSDLKVNPFSQTRTTAITQPSTPSFGNQKANKSDLKCEPSGTNLIVSWTPDPTSTPQLSYEVKLYNQSGKCVRTVKQTRPDAQSCMIDNFNLKEYSCDVTVTDVFGNSMTQSYYTPHATQSISITKVPTKTTYYLGDTLDTSGLTFDVKGNNKTVKGVNSGFTTYGFDSKTAGTKKITVNYGGATATFNVTVQKPSVTITNPVKKLYGKDKVTLNAVIQAGKDKRLYWHSDNTDVASVDQLGRLTAKNTAGRATISATLWYNGYADVKSFVVEVGEATISWSLPCKDGKYYNTTRVKPGERLILSTVTSVPGNHMTWYEVAEDDKHLGKIVCDTQYYYFEANKETGSATIKAKFLYNGQFYYSSPIEITISNRDLK